MKVGNTKTKELVLCGIFLSLLVVSSYIRLPIFGIPFTLQTFVVMLIGQVLNRKLSTLTVGSYIVAGTLGLPFFAGGGGLSYILSPTYGYILGFLFCSFIISTFCLKNKNSLKSSIVANLIGLAAVYLFGLVHYFLISNIYLKEDISIIYILIFGFLIFVPFDLVCAVFSAILAKRLDKIINMQQ